MNSTLSIALSLTFLAGLIACGEDGREKAHQTVDAVSDRIEETRADVSRVLAASSEDLSRMRAELSAGAGELSAAAKVRFSEELAQLEAERKALDAELDAAWNQGARALESWEREAADFNLRCAAAWSAFQAAEQTSDEPAPDGQ